MRPSGVIGRRSGCAASALTTPALLSRPLPPPSPGEEGELQKKNSFEAPLSRCGRVGGVGERGWGVRIRAGAYLAPARWHSSEQNASFPFLSARLATV